MDDGDLDLVGIVDSDDNLDVAFLVARATEEHYMNSTFVNEGDLFGSESEGSVNTDNLFGSESEGSDSWKAMQQQEQSWDEGIEQENTQGACCRYGKQLCCYYMQGRCRFSGRDCWFSHDVQPSHKPWYCRSCQFGEDCLRGHWVALVASTLSLASVGASAEVFSQPPIRKQICAFLKPCILPASVAAGVKWRVPEVESPLQIPAAPERDAFEVAVMEFLEMPTTDLSSLRMKDVCTHLLDTFGEPTAERRSKIADCVLRVSSRQEAARNQSQQKLFLTVADVKALIVEHVRAGIDCREGLHLDGTIDALEDDVRSEATGTGPQDDATKSRWRQWIIDESIRQDCGVVV